MKLQFAFGNPRKGKKKRPKKAARKKVVKRAKKRKTKSVKSKMIRAKIRTALKLARKTMAKRKRTKRRKNPMTRMVFQKQANGKKKLIGSTKFKTAAEYNALINRDKGVNKLQEQLHKVPIENRAGRLAVTKKLFDAKKKLAEKYILDASQKNKYIERLLEKEGTEVKDIYKEEGNVARKKKKKSKKAASKKVRRSKKKKSVKAKSRKGKGRRKMSKKAKKAFVARMKAARKGKGKVKSSKKKSRRSKGRRRSKRAKMYTHRHTRKVAHIKKGSSFRFKTTARKGKRKLSISGRVKVNPHRRNPLKKPSLSNTLGLNVSELTGMALGGALVPIVNSQIGKIPGMSTVVATINQYAGPQATGAIIPMLAGSLLNYGSEYVSGDAKKYLGMAGEGLVTAGVVALSISLGQKLMSMAGMSGVNYTPMSGMGIVPQLSGMGDVRYTPRMGDVRYTPQGSGRTDFGSADYGGSGGYTEDHKISRADFGADFSSDSVSDYQQADDSDDIGSNMAGAMS